MNKAFATAAAATLAVAFGSTAASAVTATLACADQLCFSKQDGSNTAGVSYATNYGAYLPPGVSAGSPAPVATSGNSGTQQSPFFNNATSGNNSYWVVGGPGVNPTPAYLLLDSLQTSFTLLWGSIDTYNTITFLSGDSVVGSITGSDVINQIGALSAIATNPPPGTGTGAGNFNVVALLTLSTACAIETRTVNGGCGSFNKIKFESSTNALEFALVPIPPAALLFGTALAGVGFMSRRKKAQAAA
jgi:hypothetical protein